MKILIVIILSLNSMIGIAQGIEYNTFYFASPFHKDTSCTGIKEIVVKENNNNKYTINRRDHFNKYGFIDTIQFFKYDTLIRFVYFTYQKDTIPKGFVEGFLHKNQIDYLKERSSEYQNSFFKGDNIIIKNKYTVTDSLIGWIRTCNGKLIDTIFSPRIFQYAPSASSIRYFSDSSLNIIKATTESEGQLNSLLYFSSDSLLLSKFEFERDSVDKLVRSFFFTYNEDKKVSLKVSTIGNNNFVQKNEYKYSNQNDTLVVDEIETGLSIQSNKKYRSYYIKDKLVRIECYFKNTLEEDCFLEVKYNLKGLATRRLEKRKDRIIENLIYEYIY